MKNLIANFANNIFDYTLFRSFKDKKFESHLEIKNVLKFTFKMMAENECFMEQFFYQKFQY